MRVIYLLSHMVCSHPNSITSDVAHRNQCLVKVHFGEMLASYLFLWSYVKTQCHYQANGYCHHVIWSSSYRHVPVDVPGNVCYEAVME